MIITLAMLACTSGTQHEGTIVGNPGDAKTKLANGDGIAFHSATGVVESIAMSSQTDVEFIELDLEEWEIDLLEPQINVSIPAGSWNSMSIVFEEMYISGADEFEELNFDIILEDIQIELNGQQSFRIEDSAYVLELASPDWLTIDFLLSIEEETDVFIDPESEFYDDILNPITEQTGLFVDSDGDGEVNLAEREENNVAYTASTAANLESSDDTGQNDTGAESKTVSTCGCTDSSMSYIVLPLFLCVLFRRKEE